MKSSKSVISVRVDAKVKEEATAIFKDLGLNMSTAINIFLIQVVKRGGMPFEIPDQDSNKEL